MNSYKKNIRVVVYSAITKGYDTLHNPLHIDPDVDYVCFTDEPLWFAISNNTVWTPRRFPRSGLDPTRRNRFVKILPHQYFSEYDYSVYIDGNIIIIGDVRALIEKYQMPKMLCFKHLWRDCIYEEGAACIELDKDDPVIINEQLDVYRKEGYPDRAGLIEANVLIRRHNDLEVKRLMESWWEQVKTFSRRDQLSLPYSAWKNNFRLMTMGEENSRGSSAVFRALDIHKRAPANLKERIAKLAEVYLLWRFKR